MALPRKFNLQDKVFAKLRGHPYWPARIESEMRVGKSIRSGVYDVFFYATHDMATVKESAIIPYFPNKVQMMKQCKRKKFLLAVKEIEENPDIPVKIRIQPKKKRCGMSQKVLRRMAKDPRLHPKVVMKQPRALYIFMKKMLRTMRPGIIP